MRKRRWPRCKGRKLAILSNGSSDMLNALVKNSGLDRVLDATISIDSKRIFKPAPDAYTLIEARLGVALPRFSSFPPIHGMLVAPKPLA